MPANTTQLCQPLDVAIFGPVKRSWRKTLEQWRKDYRRKGTRPKTQFPGLLKRLLETFSPHNLKSGNQNFEQLAYFCWIVIKF